MKQKKMSIISILALLALTASAQEVQRPRITGISHIAVFVQIGRAHV